MQSSATTGKSAGRALREEQQKSEYEPSEDLAKLRKEYSDKSLDVDSLPGDGNPLTLFKTWLDEACEAKVIEPNAMCLATVGENGRPSNRYVLLKGFDEKGFVWYTNYESRKGQELLNNPFAAITFWWGALERSVRIEGRVERVPAAESDEYFQVRPRGAELGAWSSDQSRPIENQEALKKKYEDYAAKFADEKVIPRPDFWGGYILVPDYIEFWKGKSSRLHDRLQFKRSETSAAWEVQRLQP